MFTIVIPMYDAANTIVEALDSCVKQTWFPKEIIIINDCSNDDSVAVVEQWKKRYNGPIEIRLEFLVENSGPSIARNKGWELAKEEYIAFLDADDKFTKTKLENINYLLQLHPNIILLGHRYTVNENTIEGSDLLQKKSTFDLLKKNLSSTPSIIAKRDVKERFDESMRYTEDHDLWLRMTQKYDETYYLDEVLTVIGRAVRTKGGLSENLWAMRKGEIKMYYKFCEINNIMLFFPLFYAFSISKHGYKKIKDMLER